MERGFSRGAEKHLTTGDDHRQRQQEQPEEPQRKLREHRHRYMTIVDVCRFGPKESSSAGVWNSVWTAACSCECPLLTPVCEEEWWPSCLTLGDEARSERLRSAAHRWRSCSGGSRSRQR